jgi:UDP-N-acetylmuramoyl-tripeptide--D-alanyl-D-alanine ligase
MNLEDDIIMRGLSNYKPVGMRQNIYKVGEITVIEDCYNASPESMRAAISVLSTVAAQQVNSRMIALLGDMYELGDMSEALHERVGLNFARAGGEMLFTFGSVADNIARGAVLGGLSNDMILRNPDVRMPQISGEMLLDNLRAGDVLLVKASRGAAAERVIAYIKENRERLCR